MRLDTPENQALFLWWYKLGLKIEIKSYSFSWIRIDPLNNGWVGAIQNGLQSEDLRREFRLAPP